MQRDKFFKEIENLKHPNETLVKTHCSLLWDAMRDESKSKYKNK